MRPDQADVVRGDVVRTGGRVLDPASDGFVVELTASEAEVDTFIADLGRMGELIEVVRSGALGIGRVGARAASRSLAGLIKKPSIAGRLRGVAQRGALSRPAIEGFFVLGDQHRSSPWSDAPPGRACAFADIRPAHKSAEPAPSPPCSSPPRTTPCAVASKSSRLAM